MSSRTYSTSPKMKDLRDRQAQRRERRYRLLAEEAGEYEADYEVGLTRANAKLNHKEKNDY